jgi:2,3-bisphosphoglycerate-dependent phosphoglycerate mutase
MHLFLIRHGESMADLLDVYEGRADFDLTERGKKQAVQMSKYMKSHYNVTKIYSSPLMRASQTASFLAKEFHLPIYYEDDLMEFNNGLLAGLSRKEADEKYPKVKDLPINQAVYGQESKVEFRTRADRMLKKILTEENKDQDIVFVTHGGMINQLYDSILKIPVENNCFFLTGDTGIHIWIIDQQTVKIVTTNITNHLKDK